MTSTDEPLLHALGARVRALRSAAGLSRTALATTAGLSLRFVAGVEAGTSNISVLNLAALARALGVSPAMLLGGAEATERGAAEGRRAVAGEAADTPPVRPPPRVALLGARGAGKSTVGRRLARRLKVRFVELDAEIEADAGLSLAEIFSMHGEAYYRRLEHAALDRVLDGEGGFVLATGGSLVTAPVTWARLRAAATTVWLRADATDHWHRVLAQGDRRPMAENPNAMSELRALLTARAPLYAAAAHIVDTRRLGVDQVVEASLSLL